MSGSPLEQYLFVNRLVREHNNRKIMEICRNSEPERLWDGVFLRMRRSSPRAGFARPRSRPPTGVRWSLPITWGFTAIP